MNSKANTAVVGTVLFLIVAAIAIFSFSQNADRLLDSAQVSTEDSGTNFKTGIESTILGNGIYFHNSGSKNLSITQITHGGNDCRINLEVEPGTTLIDLRNCITSGNFENGHDDIVIIADGKVYTKRAWSNTGTDSLSASGAGPGGIYDPDLENDNDGDDGYGYIFLNKIHLSPSNISLFDPSVVGISTDILLTNGTYSNVSLDFSSSADGNSSHPVRIRSVFGGALITDYSSLVINNSYFVISNMNFSDGIGTGLGSNIVEINGNNNRFHNNLLSGYTNSNDWLEINGIGNMIENNTFDGKADLGVQLQINVGEDSHSNIVNWNRFTRPKGPGSNGYECIRVGYSSTASILSNNTFMHNLFDECDGETEALSIKSSNNTIKWNTFYNSSSSLSLRHGDLNWVDGNFFIGLDKSNSGGIRVVGENHTIVNNYFSSLGSDAIYLTAAEVNYTESGYQNVSNVLIAHNSFYDFESAYSIRLNNNYDGDEILPFEIVIVNNIFQSNNASVLNLIGGLNETQANTIFNAGGNVFHNMSVGVSANAQAFASINPEFNSYNDYFIGNASYLDDGGNSTYEDFGRSIDYDITGRDRDSNLDIGIFEFDNSGTEINFVLSRNDVGPIWLR